MSVLPPTWAMGAVAIDGTGDLHLAKGVHLRVFSAAEIGLPIRPFIVYRLMGDQVQQYLGNMVRSDIVWVDSRGRVLALPFEVTPDNPVTGHIPRAPGVRCIAVSLATARSHQPDRITTHVPDRITGGVAGELVMEAFVDTPEGRRAIGRRDAPAYALGAPDIHGLVLRGKGIVRAGMWVQADVRVTDRLKATMLLDLPVHSAARYEGLPDAEDRAIQRVRRGAPQRLGLHDDPSVAGPAAAAGATEDDEEKRVGVLAHDLRPHLDRVLNDTSVLPRLVGVPQTLDEGVEPGAHAQAEIASLSAVLAGTADPGVAKWLGFMDVDTDPQVLASSMAVYYVRGFFAVDPAGLGLGHLISLVASGGMLTADLAPAGVPFTVPHRSVDNLPVFDFTVPVLVFPGTAPSPPVPPALAAPLSPAVLVGPKGAHPPVTADGQGPWLAEPIPPHALREVVLPLAGLEGASTVAAARLDSAGLTSLNERHPHSGRALALLPATPDDATETGTGRLSDRTAPPESSTYRVAASDWFGRWSEWAFLSIGAKARPLPPAPVFEVHYEIASATPLDNTPRFGTLRVRLNVPRPTDLAPGSNLLVRGKVEATIGGVAVSASAPLSTPGAPHLDIVVPAPAGMIPRAGQVEAIINARWNDGTSDGPLGEQQRRVLVDPRPPAAIELDPTLRYSARPDAVGRARVVLDWAAAPGTYYRVYATDETRLIGALRDQAAGGNGTAQALLDALDDETDPARRAQLYTAPERAALFVREVFTNLTAEPVAASGPGPIRFSHDLSGSLEVLAFYKVLALSSSNVESPFTQATLLPVGVPSGGPPPRPLLEFFGWTEDGDARLQVTAVRGPQPAARWRLRRSFASSEDALRMPIVAEGTVPAAGGDGPIVFEIEDDGADDLAGGSLRPWTRTTWRVEVQAPSPPGSTMPGEWSPASGPAGGMLVPPTPAAPENLTIEDDDAAGTTLGWTHPESLRGGSQGAYRFDVYRREPGGRETRAGAVLASDPAAVTGSGETRTFHFTDSPVPTGTTWRVVVMDPAGRLSLPSAPVRREGTP